MTNKIMPCLWFDDRIEEAANYYVSVFKNAKITAMTRYGDAGPLPKGKVMVATLVIGGEEFMLLNGGPRFTFSEAVSFVVKCETQAEIDYYWKRLTEDGGAESMCGWVKDKFGLSWQVVPTIIPELMQDPKKADRVMKVVMGMRKLDIAAIEKAAA
jgi:predicted 3-demethylubiquinone-9 3-methyltransferase (glyoxalase superfamily)